MYKIPAIIITLTFSCMLACGQTNDNTTIQLPKNTAGLPQKAASITLHLNKVSGLGPEGLSSLETATVDNIKKYDAEEYKGYPVIKNKPANMTNVIEYFYMTDKAQFYYQQYVAGVYSKDFLADRFKRIKVDLADTLKLSRRPLKCYISVIGGLSASNEQVYMVDANNNGDYADDVLRPLLKNVRDETLIISSAVAVAITYSSNGQIRDDSKLIFVEKSNDPNDFTMQFTFPEFHYLRFMYKGQPYMAVTGAEPFRRLSIVPDRPYFTGLGQAKSILPGQAAQIENDIFKLSDVTNNYNDLILTGADVSGFGSSKVAVATGDGPAGKNISGFVSRQVGFMAPAIKGININPAANPGTEIAIAGLKGKYVFIDFWSTYCAPCIEEFDFLKTFYAKYDRKDVEFIGVVDDRDDKTTMLILKQHAITWPNIKAEAKTTQINGYGDIMAYPTTFLLDRDGKIIAVDLRGDALMNKLKTLLPLK